MSKYKLNNNFKRINLILDILSVITLIILFLITYISWTRLPDIIPTHYDLNGNINNYGSKNILILLPCITLFSFFLLFILSKYPETYNYAIKINENNKEIQYAMGSTFMKVLNFEMVVLFLIIQIEIIKFSPSISIVMIVMIIITISCIIYFKKSRKFK